MGSTVQLSQDCYGSFVTVIADLGSSSFAHCHHQLTLEDPFAAQQEVDVVGLEESFDDGGHLSLAFWIPALGLLFLTEVQGDVLVLERGHLLVVELVEEGTFGIVVWSEPALARSKFLRRLLGLGEFLLLSRLLEHVVKKKGDECAEDQKDQTQVHLKLLLYMRVPSPIDNT